MSTTTGDLRKIANRLGGTLERIIGRTDKEHARSIHIVSLSKTELRNNLGAEMGSKVFEKLQGSALANVGGSKGTRVPSIQRLNEQDLAGLGGTQHLYYLKGDQIAIITDDYTSMKVRLNNTLRAAAGRSNEAVNSESKDLPDPPVLKVSNKSNNQLITLNSRYGIKSGFTLSLAKQVSKFTTNITLIVPKDNVTRTRNIFNRLEKAAEEQLSGPSSVPVNRLQIELSKMLNYMSEKRPTATSKKVKAINSKYNANTKIVSTTVGIKNHVVDSKGFQRSQSSLDSILGALNDNISEAVRGRMHASGAPSNKRYLRNQTGRFSESVLVTAVTLSASSITAYYNYQAEPYDVFDPAGEPNRWSSRGRDPNRIAGNAIRDLLRAEMAANNIGKSRIFTRRAR